MSRWQIKAISLFSHDDRRRDLFFDLNAVNIVVGESGSGKSALCEIVDYCLGSSVCHIPGLVREASSWVALLLDNNANQTLIARKLPDASHQSSSEVYLAFGAHLALPRSASLITANANTLTLTKRLEQMLGIGNVNATPVALSREAARISARHVIPFLIQDDDVIINKTVLLRGAQDERRLSILESFPYLLGVTSESDAQLELELVHLTRRRDAEQRRVAALNRGRDTLALTVRRLAAEAAAVGLLDIDVQTATPERIISDLRNISDWQPQSTASSGDTLSQLESSRRLFTAQRYQLLSELSEARSAYLEADLFVRTTGVQSRRLETVELFNEDSTEEDTTCPLCSSLLSSETQTLASLKQAHRELRHQLSSAERERPQIDSYLVQLQDRVDALSSQLQINRAQIQAAAGEAAALQANVDLDQRRMRVVGRISYYLEGEIWADVVTEGFPDSLAQRIEELQGSLDSLARTERLHDAERQVALLADQLLARLPFPANYPQRAIYLNTRDITTGVLTEQRRIAMRDIGSDENYLSLHVAVTLGLHRFFKTHGRPVPGFIIYDQLSRPFYPPDDMPGIIRTRSDSERSELKKYFDVLFDEVTLQGDIQIIVLEHAYFADDDRYVKAVGSRLLEDEKLIPADWPKA